MPRPPKEPPRIPGYEILEPIGSGGQGSVWRARQKSLDRVVAIKVLWAEDAADPVLAKRFIEEARIASKLNHPNIIQVIDVGEGGGSFWYAMEYVAGVTALELFRERGPLPEGEVLEIAWQVAQALQHGCDRGLIHGDLKPENILISPEGVAKVVDFGLARLSKRRGWRSDRTSEPVQGTEGFVAPEILENRSTGDARSDLFALGVTIYELLATTLPPGPKKGSPLGPDVRERRPNASRRTAELVMRLLAPDPAKRPESPAKVLEELGRRSSISLPATVSPVAPIKPPSSGRLRRDHPRLAAAKQHKKALWILVGLLIAGAVVLLMTMTGSEEPPPHREPPQGVLKPAPPDRADPPPKEPGDVPTASSVLPEPVSRPASRPEPEPVSPAPTPRTEPEPAVSRPAEEPVQPPPRPEPEPQTATSRPEPEPESIVPPTPPQPAPSNGASSESRPPELVPVSSADPAVRVIPPPAAFLNAPWTVVTPAGESCDLTIRSPADFATKDTEVDAVPENRAKGLSIKQADEPGAHLATFRCDRASALGPREFTVVFKRGSALHKIRLRFQVTRPVLLALAPAPALRDALKWLERHQAPDGSVSAATFSQRCNSEKRCDGAGRAQADVGVTALAALAALKSGESADWVRSLLGFLVRSQQSDGRFAGIDNPYSSYCHMIATEACALGWHLLGDSQVRQAAQRGIEAIEAARNLEATGGAWRYGIQSGDNDTSVTIWALRALVTGRMAGFKVDEAAISGGLAWIRRVTETNTHDVGFGRIGYNSPGGLPIRPQDRSLQFPPVLSESLTAGALAISLQAYDRKTTEKVAQSGLALVLLCRPYWDAASNEAAKFVRERLGNPNADLGVISTRDFYYWQHATALFRTWKLLKGRSIPEDRKWNLAKVLGPEQHKDGCAAGSFEPADPWGPECGRSGSTAMLALALANEQYGNAVVDEVTP